jgi:hypothetical protein
VVLRDAGGPPVLDRAAFERLFGVSRRQAIRLMQQVGGGYVSGKTALVERDSVVAYLSAMDEPVRRALTRQKRIVAALDRKQQPQIAAAPQPAPAGSLPQGVVRTAPGTVQIHYESATDLLSRIVDLASSAANDFDEFRRSVE